MKQTLRRYEMLRYLYRSLRALYTSPRLRRELWRLAEWIDESRLGEAGLRRDFSLEFTITGRNDDYEPSWNQYLESVLAYNRALFRSSGIDFRVAFVEWNPPEDRPLLSPALVERFDFVRAIVVSSSVHAEVCEAEDLVMMLNFGLNAALRTSESDFLLVSGGDVFLGRDVARWMMRNGLRTKCLYRAIRIDVRRDPDFMAPRADALEDPSHIVRINQAYEPPYYEACGDFLLMDRVSFQRARGFDENIRHARLHLDSRCCATAMALGLKCRLIGHVYHLNHTRSYVNATHSCPGKSYDAGANIPYQNPENWGLRDRTWVQANERLFYVS